MNINFFSPVRLTLALLPHMLERGRGRIVNISSVAATLSSPGESSYDASKAAVTAFSEAMAIDLWETGVKVLVVYPGLVDTELFSPTTTRWWRPSSRCRSASWRGRRLRRLGRRGRPDLLAGVVRRRRRHQGGRPRRLSGRDRRVPAPAGGGRLTDADGPAPAGGRVDQAKPNDPKVLQSPSASMSKKAPITAATTGIRHREPLRTMTAGMYHDGNGSDCAPR